ncbi:MAG: DUF4621 domain-containing protein [Bacteroidales bacterium]|nr:DUF4621 domain-containing protein [Bacteroidales bacterium]
MNITLRSKRLYTFLAYTCLISLFSSCVDKEFDLTENTEKDVTLFSKYIELPLGNDTIHIKDQIGDLEGIVTNEKGEYSFVKSGQIKVQFDESINLANSIHSQTTIGLSALYEVCKNYPAIPANNYPIETVRNQFDFDISKDVLRLDSVHFTKGQNSLIITINPKQFVNSRTSKGSYASLKIQMPYGFYFQSTDNNMIVNTDKDGHTTISIDQVSLTQATSKTLYLSKGVFNGELKDLPYEINAVIHSDGTLQCTEGVGFDVNLSVNELGFDDIWGVFDIDVATKDTFDFDLTSVWEYFSNKEDSLVFYQPYILLKSSANVSIPAKMHFSIDATNSLGINKNLQNDFQVNVKDATVKLGSKKQFGEESIESLDINGLLQTKPNSLIISASANALQDTADHSLQHYISKLPEGTIDYTVCIPFCYDEGMCISFDEDLKDVFDQETDDLLFNEGSVGLTLDITNQLPVDATMVIHFTDEQGKSICFLESVDLKAKSQQKDIILEFDSQKVRTAKGLRFQLKTTYSGTHEFITNKDFIGMNIKLFKKGGINFK